MLFKKKKDFLISEKYSQLNGKNDKIVDNLYRILKIIDYFKKPKKLKKISEYDEFIEQCDNLLKTMSEVYKYTSCSKKIYSGIKCFFRKINVILEEVSENYSKNNNNIITIIEKLMAANQNINNIDCDFKLCKKDKNNNFENELRYCLGALTDKIKSTKYQNEMQKLKSFYLQSGIIINKLKKLCSESSTIADHFLYQYKVYYSIVDSFKGEYNYKTNKPYIDEINEIVGGIKVNPRKIKPDIITYYIN